MVDKIKTALNELPEEDKKILKAIFWEDDSLSSEWKRVRSMIEKLSDDEKKSVFESKEEDKKEDWMSVDKEKPAAWLVWFMSKINTPSFDK